MERSAKYLKNLVGAPGFEPGASCAQGRRATRLRYAPTSCFLLILLHSGQFTNFLCTSGHPFIDMNLAFL